MSEWIKTSKKLPKPGKPALTFTSGVYGGYGIGETYRWGYLDKWTTTWRGNPVPSPTYWMMLPEPPTEGEE